MIELLKTNVTMTRDESNKKEQKVCLIMIETTKQVTELKTDDQVSNWDCHWDLRYELGGKLCYFVLKSTGIFILSEIY